MKLVDTNILVRYFVADEADAQTEAAARFIEAVCSAASPAVVTSIVLAELVWVLGSRYRFTKPEIVSVLDMLLDSPTIVFDEEEEVLAAVDFYRDKPVDLADCLIAARASSVGAEAVVTFDEKASRYLQFELLSPGN